MTKQTRGKVVNMSVSNATLQYVFVSLCALATSCSSLVLVNEGVRQNPETLRIKNESENQTALPRLRESRRSLPLGLDSLPCLVNSTNRNTQIYKAFVFELEVDGKPFDKYAALPLSMAKLGIIHFPGSGGVYVNEGGEFCFYATFSDHDLLRSYKIYAYEYTSLFAIQAGLNVFEREIMHTNAPALMNNWFVPSSVVSNTYGAFVVTDSGYNYAQRFKGVVTKDGTFTPAVMDNTAVPRFRSSFSQNGVDYSLYFTTNGNFDSIYELVGQTNDSLSQVDAHKPVVYRNLITGK